MIVRKAQGSDRVVMDFCTHQESALDTFVHLGERRGVVVRAGRRHIVSLWNDKKKMSREKRTDVMF